MNITQLPWKRLFTSAVITASVAALIACGGGSSSSTSSAGETDPVYTAIFDAGSSGTRVSLFKVTPGNGGYPGISSLDFQKYGDDGINDFLNNAGIIIFKEWNKNKGQYVNVLPNGTNPNGCVGTPIIENNNGTDVTTGFQNLGPNDVGPCVIQPLLNSLDVDLNKYGITRAQIKTELFATAGMRTEDKRNGGTHSTFDIEQFYSQIKAYAANMGFATGDYKTINGNSEEGVWSWTNLNDIYYNVFGNPALTAAPQPPVGDFEVGGSSMQIAFPLTSGTPTSDATNSYLVKINGKTFSIYSKTFLGFGGDDARKYVRAYGYPSGASYTRGSECFTTGATTSNSNEDSGIALYPSNNWISSSVGLSNWQILPNTALDLTATSPGYDFTACTTKFNTVINQVVSLARNNDGTENLGATVTMNTLKGAISNSTAPFVGIDGFYYSASGLGLENMSPFNPATFQTTLQSHCSLAEASTKSRDQQTCAQATYMNTFLWGSTGLFSNNTNASFKGVLPSNNPDGTPILTWTRGYLLIKYAN